MKIIPPQNPEFESSVIAHLILFPHDTDVVSDIISPADFYSNSNAAIFSEIINAYQNKNEISLASIADRLREKVDTVYLSKLLETPIPGNLEERAQAIKEKSIRRQTIYAASEIIKKAQTENGGGDFLADAQKTILEIDPNKTKTDYVNMSQAMERLTDYLSEIKESRSNNIFTGLKRLDFILRGISPSDLVIVAARPAMGKTALALSIAKNISQNGGNVAIFSLEMSVVQLAVRLLAMDAKFNVQALRTGKFTADEHRYLMDFISRLAEIGIFVNDTAALKHEEIARVARRMMRLHDIDCIIVDYMQLIGRRNKKSTNDEVGEISRSLKNLAKELEVPIIALSQLSRAVENRDVKKPRLSDLRDSGEIEQDADTVIFIYRDEVYNEDTPEKGIAELIVSKQRQGPTGVAKIAWLSEYTMFANLAEC